MIRFIINFIVIPVTVASQMGAMNGWSWDSLAKTASDAAETTRLVTLRSAKQAEIMYIENNHIKSATAQFGHDAFEALEAGDEAKAKALFNACKTLVDSHRADVAAAQAEIDRLNAEIAVVGEDERAMGGGDDATGDGRGAAFAAPRSGNSLNDL